MKEIKGTVITRDHGSVGTPTLGGYRAFSTKRPINVADLCNEKDFEIGE